MNNETFCSFCSGNPDDRLQTHENRNKRNKTERFFENLPDLASPEQVAQAFGLQTSTVYDWNYRQKLKRVPAGLFLKFNRRLYVQTAILREWFASQNPHCA